MGIAGATPLLVYDRIDTNRRNTLRLLPVFAALLPLAYGVTQHIIPLYFYRTHLTLGRAKALLDVASTESRMLTIVLLALIFTSCVAFLGYISSPFLVLWRADARPADRGKEPAL